MKNAVYTLIFALFLNFNSFSATSNIQDSVVIGDVLTINTPESQTFKDIDFPKLNLVVKRGGVASYNSVDNVPVVVSEIKADKNGNTIVVLKRQDGKKFFNQYKEVSANLQDALASGELSVIK
ncbi:MULTISPECIES: hypothetical protein [Mangrovimonas]|uniref:hypothetical protein n=1 Tax=Mangrovimonas TaxID=1211036 RepID=UPI0006B42851|nr:MULTISPECIES: hypothetical protein [Mangrovimonas]OMP31596.1 hypothetical protein BKM32_07720 [Mangrovimonas sp. DI 80]